MAQRFPGTSYAADAAQKAVVARDHLAGKEMEIGRYYYREKSYLAGINRFKRVVTEYRNTSQTPEALYRLAEGYMALGIVSEAQTAAAVLGYNYPNSDWYKDAYQLVSSDGQAPGGEQAILDLQDLRLAQSALIWLSPRGADCAIVCGPC